ncbi:MAG: hypothetical protein WCO56_03115 [Verrucomicrobiota bacterium]
MNLLNEWERSFRTAARVDNCGVFREHIKRLNLPSKPKQMLEGTVCVVQMCVANLCLDNRNKHVDRFLSSQKYNPAGLANVRYAYTFDLFGKAFARILVDPKAKDVDLADLFGSRCYAYKVAGFEKFWISHLDWSPLKRNELRKLENSVASDLLFDYEKDEINFWFDLQPDPSCLCVTVHDV